MSTRTQRGATRVGDQATMASVIGGTTTGSSTTTGTTRTGDTTFRGNTTQRQLESGGHGGDVRPQGGDAGHQGDQKEGGEPVGFFLKNPAIVPATVVVSIILAFGLMMLLNWLAGGGAPFTR